MKNTNKLAMCGIGVFSFTTIYQYVIGNKGFWIVAGICLFGMGFGWYACKSKQESFYKERKTK